MPDDSCNKHFYLLGRDNKGGSLLKIVQKGESNNHSISRKFSLIKGGVAPNLKGNEK
jgi:hypothetical protein